MWRTCRPKGSRIITRGWMARSFLGYSRDAKEEYTRIVSMETPLQVGPIADRGTRKVHTIRHMRSSEITSIPARTLISRTQHCVCVGRSWVAHSWATPGSATRGYRDRNTQATPIPAIFLYATTTTIVNKYSTHESLSRTAIKPWWLLDYLWPHYYSHMRAVQNFVISQCWKKIIMILFFSNVFADMWNIKIYVGRQI